MSLYDAFLLWCEIMGVGILFRLGGRLADSVLNDILSLLHKEK